MLKLLPDQEKQVGLAIEAMQSGHKSILMQAATGSGKSVMASYLLHRARAKGKKAWFMVPRKNLIHQMHNTFNDFGIKHSYIAAGRSLNPHEKAHICSTETLKRRLDMLDAPNLAFIDETHYGGNGLNTIIDWMKGRGTWIVGLSATPWLLSGQGLGCWYDHMICGESISELIRLKRLSDYKPFAPSRLDLSMVHTKNGEYVKREITQKMESDQVLIGNAVKHYKDHAFGKMNIAYCTSIKHSQMVAEEFRNQGVPAAHIDGETPEAEKRRIIRALADREILTITNCELLTFGFDLASQVGRAVTIESMSDLRPTKSLALQMQKWGRVLRMKDNPALIFDHANNFKEHGLPCDDRNWTLQDRVKGGSGGGGERAIPAKLCPECYLTHRPALECPNCGYEYPVKSRELFEVEGELEEIQKNQARKKKRMRIGMAKTLADLREIKQDEGYGDGWVMRVAKAKGIKK